MKKTGFIARVRTLFQELFYEQETMVDRITLILIEETPSGPYWNVKIEEDWLTPHGVIIAHPHSH